MDEKERKELSYFNDIALKASMIGMTITIFSDYFTKMPFQALVVDSIWLFLTVIFFICNRVGKNPVILINILVPVYIVLVTFMMFYTGGLEGTSHFVFFILICFSTIALGLKFGLFITTLSVSAFSLATWFEYLGLVKVHTFSGIPLSQRFPIDKIIGTQFFFGLLSYVICLLCGFLAKKIKKEKEIRELKEELASTLASIHETTAGLATALEQEKLYEMIFSICERKLNADGGSIAIYNEKDAELEIVAAFGSRKEIVVGKKLKLGERITGKAAKERKPILSDKVKDEEWYKKMPQYEEVKSGMCLPMVLQDKLVGVLNLKRTVTDEKFTENDLIIASILATYAATFIKNIQLYSDLRKALDELKIATAQTVQMEKLVALGELAAGVAHELNQPLNVMKIIAQSSLRDISRGEVDQQLLNQDLKDIIEQINKMAEIIDHMRVYTRRTEGLPFEKINIKMPIEGMFKLFGQQLAVHNIEVIKEIAPDLPLIMADPIRLEQVFTNLIKNAREAVEKDPKPEGMKIWIRAYQEGDKVIVEIEDNGSGIPEDIKNRIFEPFFTTKPPGQGTGLGLSLVHKILEEHKAKIEFESELKKGTKFKITFPVVTQ